MVWKCPPLHLPNWSNHWKWKQEMNAYELASTIEKEIKDGFGMGFMPHAIKLLREQADQIAELKNARDYWCLQYKDVINKLQERENG